MRMIILNDRKYIEIASVNNGGFLDKLLRDHYDTIAASDPMKIINLDKTLYIQALYLNFLKKQLETHFKNVILKEQPND